ncbi:hypothetical protein U9M48_001088 [Paspalum notatum var. saurae]|uniref:DUF4220 domain-containing protein n=1 Tax=Paspalum notatum var. saurae TaxID=547442 RepID=A0AAQ3PNP1_PASNO
MAWDNGTTIYNEKVDGAGCPDRFLTEFYENMGRKMWRVNMLILIDAVLAGVIVVIGAYAQRYRHHPLTRFIFHGATTLFLPIISYVVSTIGADTNDYIDEDDHIKLAAFNAATCHGGFHRFTVVSWAFLVQIVVINTSIIVSVGDREGQNKGPPIQLLVQGFWTLYLGVTTMGSIKDNIWQLQLELMPFAIIFAKIVLKYYAYLKSRESLAFRRNPDLIFGYMKQLQQQEASQISESPSASEGATPPPLLVMGEEGMQVEKQPHGYVCIDLSRTRTTLVNNIGLVTIDKVWQLDNILVVSRPQLKDICLSFALFKLLRCRFARYELANAGSMRTLNFFWGLLLQDGEHVRVFGLIADELSFVQEYYFSSHPVSYSVYWLPILSVGISLLSITYCLSASVFIIKGLMNWRKKYSHQLRCDFWCSQRNLTSDKQRKPFGFFLFDDVPLCVMLMKHWDEKMGQSSVLVVHPRTTLLLRLRRLLGLPDLDRSVKVPEAVKVKHPYYQQEGQTSQDKITATHLSRYCAYLMAWSPDLLPDDDEWSKSLYEAVRKDARCALITTAAAGPLTPPEAEYEKVIQLLSAYSKHQVLRNGVKLGAQLADELIEGVAWKVLAGFWSEMVLYIAPSDNVRGHLEANARGGELITLLWALLTHAGIVSRPAGHSGSDAGVGTATTADGADGSV